MKNACRCEYEEITLTRTGDMQISIIVRDGTLSVREYDYGTCCCHARNRQKRDVERGNEGNVDECDWLLLIIEEESDITYLRVLTRSLTSTANLTYLITQIGHLINVTTEVTCGTRVNDERKSIVCGDSEGVIDVEV